MSLTSTSATAPAEAAAAPGLRARKLAATRQALQDAAFALFADRGFEATTVEDIAAVVDVSPRTFHRHFPRKDDVVFAGGGGRLERFEATLRASAAPTVLTAVREGAAGLVAEYAVAPDRERARSRLVASTPSLRAQNLNRYDGWSAALARFAAEAVGQAPDDRWPATFAACAMAALSSATRRWAAHDDLDLADELDGVLELLVGLDRPRQPADASSAR